MKGEEEMEGNDGRFPTTQKRWRKRRVEGAGEEKRAQKTRVETYVEARRRKRAMCT